MAKDYQEKEFDDEVYEDGYYEDNYEEEELEEDGEEIEKPRKVAKKPKKSLIEAEFDDEEKIKDEDDDDDEDEDEDEDDEKDDSWEKERKINVSYACEDCDYRWDDIVIKKSEFDSEDEIFETTCPMCGSMSITQI